MGKITFGLIFALTFVFLVSSVSAQITFLSQPSSLYNLGDLANVSANVVATSQSSGPFYVYLVCGSVQSQVYQEYLSLAQGDQKSVDVLVPPLSQTLIGGQTGTCTIKASFNKESQSTNQFKVSNIINVNVSSDSELKPGQEVMITGNAVKEDGKPANGIAELKIASGSKTLYQDISHVDNGYFSFNFSMPEDSKAGLYSASVNVYEVNSDNTKTNTGYSSFSVLVRHIPTSLELILNKSLPAGSTLNVRGILHDQTGDQMDSTVNFTIKNSNGEIMDQEQKATGDLLELPINYNTPIGTWSVVASSNGLVANSNFKILPNEQISVGFADSKLLVTNTGNVPYNKTVTVNLGGNQSVSFPVDLGVNESKQYVLSAPKGNYSVNVLSGGSSLFNGQLSLTGNVIGVRSASSGLLNIISYPSIWAFAVLVLGFVMFFLFRRSHKKSFFGKVNLGKLKSSGKKMEFKEEKPVSKEFLINSENRADLSLSIQGDKQDSSIICLNLKNHHDLKSRKTGVAETLDKLKRIAERTNSMLYENGSYVFFIFAPIKTRTFKNDMNAVMSAQEIKKLLDDHNKLFKQKIEFGISLDKGTIVARHVGKGIKFMILGSFATMMKKLSSISNGEVLLSQDIRESVMSEVKTQKHMIGDIDYYTISEVRNREKSQKFIQDFMRKMEKENKERKKD